MIAFTAFTVALLLTAGLVQAAPLLGWLDRREGLEHRKPRTGDVPVVGGAAILGAMVVLDLLDPTSTLPWPALAGAFLLGLVDDVRRGGLGPAAKLSGQILVATLIVVAPGPGFDEHTAMELLAIAGVALVAMNVVNLFDHADAMAGTACCVALWPGAPALAAAVGGYLPFNVLFRRRKTFRESVPMTMLGDSGTHLLGVAIAVTPGAAWLLLVPLLDAVRVVIGRWSRGVPFWEGDRTHLGNRLVGVGLGPLGASMVVVLLVAPPLVVQALFTEAWPSWVGFAVSAVLYALAVLWTRGVTGSAAKLPAAETRPLEHAGATLLPEEESLAAAPKWTVVRRRRDDIIPAAPPAAAPTSAPEGESEGSRGHLLPTGSQVARAGLEEPLAADRARPIRRAHPLTGSAPPQGE